MAYNVTLSNSGTTGGGPRLDLGQDGNPSEYMIVGAYDNINNIDTKNRPLKIYSSTSKSPITVMIVNLPDASTAPARANLENLVVDKATGKLYLQ